MDLAAYIDNRRAAAVKECQQLTGTTGVRVRYDKPGQRRRKALVRRISSSVASIIKAVF